MDVYDELIRALKEIERLKMAVKDTKENADAIIIEQQEEIENLHNIINNLENEKSEEKCENY